MSALLEAVHFVLWYEIQQEDVKTQNVGHRQGIFFFLRSTQTAVISAKNLILQHTIHYCVYKHIVSYIKLTVH